MKHLDYRGYTGSIEYNKDDDLLFGKVLGIKSLISYEGSTGSELEKDFHSAINVYLKDCKTKGLSPEKPFKGSFNVRLTADLHKKAALLAIQDRMSLNSFVAESIRERIHRESSSH